MAYNANSSVQRRNNPFSRAASPASAPNSAGKPRSITASSPAPLPSAPSPTPHSRSQSNSSFGAPALAIGGGSRHFRNDSRNGTPTSATFAPSFIKVEEKAQRDESVDGIEGENDFSGKRYVWLKEPQAAFVKGWVVEELDGNRIRVQTDDGAVSHVLPRLEIASNNIAAARGRRRKRG